MIDVIKTRPQERKQDFPDMIDLHELMGEAEIKSNTRLWEDENGKVLGFALVDPKYSRLNFEISPHPQSDELADEMIAWAAIQLQKAGCHSISTGCRSDNSERIAIVQRNGFMRKPGETIHLERSLATPIPTPQLPQGFTIRSVRGEEEVEQIVELHRAAFGTDNMTVEQRLSMMRVPDYERALDLLAVAPDGTLASFCVGGISHEDNARTGQNEGWLDPVGTHPKFRRRGLASALMLEGLTLLKERGVEVATTNTWGENNAMKRTAESVGFSVASTTSWYTKTI
ncbi:GNAT family N-acetyltransferase [Chloroflexi bacterium TSY]|nr:GNAT family N-acetyltransferase [Chloroflexi bacterium TSY]